MLSAFRIIGLDNRLKEEAIAVRKANALKLPDSVIAATSNVTGFKLITADRRFANVPDLDCILYTS